MVSDSIMVGIVVATYPEGPSVDVLIPEDGSRISNVQVMVPTGSSDTGTVDLPDVGLPNDESRWDLKKDPARYMRAVLAVYRGIPVCIGFLLPQENQISFAQKNRRIMRHASDVYVSIDDDGNTEVSHPSGTYLRIGTTAEHEDLAGKDFDKTWAITKNTDKQVHVQLAVANGGEQRASLNIDPSGNVTLIHQGNLDVQTAGNASIDVGGDASVSIDGSADVEVTGDATLAASSLTVDADTTINGQLQVNGGINATQDVVAGGVSLQNHLTTQVQSGSDLSGPPQ